MATRSATALTTTIASRRRSVVGVFLLVLVYPMLLLLATGLGFRLGAGLDVSARTALARALSYAADPESRVSFSADTKRLTVVPLDTGTLRALGLGSGAVASSTPSPSSSTAAGGPTEIGGTPSSQAGALAPATATPGTGAGGTAPPAGGASATPSSTPASPSQLLGVPVTVLPSPSPVVVLPGVGVSPLPLPSPAPVALQLSGRVYDAVSNAPVAGAQVIVTLNLATSFSAVTDQNGNFSIAGMLPSTTYSYSVNAAGYQPGGGTFTTNSQGEATLNIALSH